MSILDAFRLDGKVALVTGASRGLGLQIAQALGEAGATVVLTARREQPLAEAAARLADDGIATHTAVCDITDPAAVEAAVETVLSTTGHVDILVNNAGATWGAPLEEIPLEAWAKVMRTNVDGTFFITRAVARHLIARGQGGRIVNIASVAGLRGTDPAIMQTLPYNTSKGAVVNFTRDLAAKLAVHQITVNCICPGFFPTRMSAALLEHARERILALTPLGRLGGDDDLKGIVVLLASPASAYITGQVIAVDGGLTAI